MVVGEVATATQVLVVGGGPGGYAAALRAAAFGRQVTLVERDAVGGTCLNVGCIPSKVLIHAAEVAHLATTSSGTGVRVETTVDLAELQDHLRSVVSGLTGGVAQLLAASGVTVVRGTARFSRPNRMAILDDDAVSHIEFDEAILATGSRPVELTHLPFDGERVVDSTGALFAFTDVPATLIVVGGGYIGVELGTAWRKLGAQVTIVEAEPALLPGLEPRLGRVVARRLADLGIDVRTSCRAGGLTDVGLEVAGADGATEILPAERVIVAVGRRPNTDDLGLDVVGIRPTPTGHLIVDPTRWAGRRVLAIGDITPGPALAHKATAEAEVAARTAAGIPARFEPAAVPAVVFADPEVATVGATVAEAEAVGVTARRFVFPMTASSRARTLGAVAGHVELVADGDGTVIGAHLACANASELVAELALAIELAATVEDVAGTIHPHPTMSEGLLEAAHGLLGLPLHVTRR
ncbi:MAG: dihydrolipoyl dehydrogenase [Acidimicrobiales bacterium]